MNQAITREAVIWLYKCVLGREPESDAPLRNMPKDFETFEDARTSILLSDEFLAAQREREKMHRR